MTITPDRIDDREDGLIIWRYTLPSGDTVDVEAPSEPEAATKYAAWEAAQKETP